MPNVVLWFVLIISWIRYNEVAAGEMIGGDDNGAVDQLQKHWQQIEECKIL